MPRIPPDTYLEAEFRNAFVVEKQLLEKLGVHPKIVRYALYLQRCSFNLGTRYRGPYKIQGMEEGLLLEEANCGDPQSYIHRCNIDNALRRKWSLQIAEAVAYVHMNSIIHSNLSTANILVHQTSQTPDLLLADFRGSNCTKLGLNGQLVPDDPYFDPQLTDFNSPKVDVFSLGIVIYIIMTGQ
jgi:serine/threonine protein kinase